MIRMDAADSSNEAGWPPDDIRRIVDALADGILISDTDARILYLNPAAEQLVGRSKSALFGEPVGVLVSPKYSEWLPHFGRMMAGEAPELLGRRLNVSLVDAAGAE